MSAPVRLLLAGITALAVEPSLCAWMPGNSPRSSAASRGPEWQPSLEDAYWPTLLAAYSACAWVNPSP